MSYQDNAFPILEGGVNIGPSINQGGGYYLCVAAGNIQITFNTGAKSTIVCTAGQLFDLTTSIKIIEIVDGIFHRA